ncbi:MAG: hypothetical protein JRC92_06505 [Deltaproteobacteria bacterium]|nr:hypothetical protein [Deltaproteobacteria bacterium]
MALINGKNGGEFGRREQPWLWDMPSLDPTERVKAAMREALAGCSLSREQVVDEMNRLAVVEGITTNGRRQQVSVDILNKWDAPGDRRYIIPTKYLPIFCHAAGSILPLKALCGAAGAEAITKDEAKRLEWANIEIERRRLTKRSKHLAEEAGI